MKRFALCLSLSLLYTLSGWSQSKSAADPKSDKENWFNFWVGDWDASWTNPDGSSGKGTNHITRILDESVVMEHFEITDGNTAGFKGVSISVLNPRAQQWHQAWADNQGGYFNFIGLKEGDKRIFKTLPREVNNKTIVQRMVFHNIKENSFTWDWEISTDNEKTWQLNWQINYTRKKP